MSKRKLSIAEQQGKSAKKRFGQNFLHDHAVIESIIAAIHPKSNQRFVEIGPGHGALTHPFTKKLDDSNHYHLLELDRDLARKLEVQYGGNSMISIHQADALFFDFNNLHQASEDPQFRVFGNLPYNISTPLIFHLLSFNSQGNDACKAIPLIFDMHFMLQKEVVDRLAAAPSTSDYGRLSVMAQYHCQVTPLIDVPPEAFSPAPKVQSAVVRLKPYANKPVVAKSEKALEKVVRAAFSQRRKTLRNTLKGFVESQQLIDIGIDPSARAETLSVNDFVQLSELVTDIQ